MAQDTTRRALFGSAAVAAVGLAMPGMASQVPAALDAAFADWRHCLAVVGNTDEGDDPESPYWSRLDRAEVAILNAPDASPSVASMRLWIALQHMLDVEGRGQAIIKGDLLALLAQADDFDWHARLTLNALAALEGRAGAQYRLKAQI